MAPGVSAKFFLDGDSAVFINQKTSYRIRKSTFGFSVTDGQGNTFIYGGGDDVIEKTRVQAACPNEHYYPNQAYHPTGWFLKHIYTSAKDTISYTYSELFTSYSANRVKSTVTEQKAINSSLSCPCQIIKDVDCSIQLISFSKKLDFITTTNHAKIAFGYLNRKDNVNDKLLMEMSVYSTFSGKDSLIRNINFDYVYGNNRQRPFLHKVSLFSGTKKDSMIYTLNYNSLDLLPDRLSEQTDYWGYFNGRLDGELGPDYAHIGTLSKIIYPTGGYDTIFYEPNNLNTQSYITQWGSGAYLTGRGIEDHRCQDFKSTFTIYKNKTSAVRVSGLADWQFQQPPVVPYHHMKVMISKAGTSEILYSKRIDAGNTLPYETLDVSELLKTVDSIKLEVTMSACGEYVYGSLSVEVGTPVLSYVNVPYAGVRTTKTITVNNFGKQEVRKYYYHKFDDPKKSSGVRSGYGEFNESIYSEYFCPKAGIITCFYAFRHNRSLIDLFGYNSAPLLYTNVTEVHGDDFENGAIRHSYTVSIPISPFTVNIASTTINASSPFVAAPFSIMDDPVYEVKREYLYKSGDTLKVNREEKYEYKYLGNIKRRYGYTFRKRFDDKNLLFTPYFYKQYDVAGYFFSSYWLEKKETVETIYTTDNKKIVKTKKIHFDDAPLLSNISSIQEVLSTGDTINIYYKYPNNYKGQQVYDSMMARSITTPMIEQKKFSNQQFVEGYEINYGFSNTTRNTIIISEIKSLRKNLAPESRYIFQSYDNRRNILERSKTGDAKEVYLWGYNGQYPVAKIIGSDYNSIIGLINPEIINKPINDQQLRDEINKIRNAMLGKPVIVSSYTYMPLIGITSETSPTGQNTFYEYDGFGRLRSIRDHQGKIIKLLCYNYSGQTENCNTGL